MSVATESAASLYVRAALTPWLLDRPLTGTPSKDSRVYFIQSGTDGPIKIGKANDPEARLAELQVGSPSALRLIGSIPGGIAEERALHARFSADRVRGEWFSPSAPLLDYLAGVLA